MTRRERLAAVGRLGAAVLCGLSAWLSLGVLAVSDEAGGPAPLGLVSPVWVLVVAVVAALALARAVPRLPTPLLLVPAVVVPAWLGATGPVWLMWAGPLAAVPWALVAVGAVADAWSERVAVHASPRAGPFAAGLAAFVVLGAFTWAGRPPVSGDEPHYLLISTSLLADGDVDLANDYALERYWDFYGGSLDRHTVVTADGREYSYHGIGVGALALPGFAVAGVTGARVTMLLISALGVAALWSAVRVATGSVGAAWLAVQFLVLQAPFAMQAGAVYPEAAGSTAMALVLLVLVRLEAGERVSTLALAGLGAALAVLPWLHLRLGAVSVAGALGVAWWLRQRRVTPDGVAWFVAAPVVSVALWVAAAWVMFGTLDPTAAYRQVDVARPGAIPAGIVGLLTDRQHGLLPYAPAAVFGAIGLFARAVPVTRACAALAFVATLLAVTSHGWWGGAASPARLIVAVLPVLAFGLGLWWRNAAPAGRAAAGALVAFAATLVALGGFFGAVSLIGNADGRAGLFNSLSASVNLQAALPSRFAPGASLSDEIVTIVVWAVIGLALVTLVRRWRGDARAAWPAAAWALIAWLSLSSSSVWTAHDVNPVTAGRSQVALAGAVARGWPGSGLIGFRPATPAAVIPRLAFRAPSDRDPAIVLETGELPAGTYRLDVASAVPVSLTAHAGRAPQPPWRWPAAPGEPVTFTLATAVRRLTVLADPAAAGSPPSVTVRPLIARADSPIAEHVARYGGLLVYAHDAALTFEAGGFWLQRGRETAFTVADDRGRTPAVELDLEAGDELVAVRFTREGWSRDLALQPHERAIVEVLPADVVLPVTVEVSGSRAPLGVWIGLSSPR